MEKEPKPNLSELRGERDRQIAALKQREGWLERIGVEVYQPGDNWDLSERVIRVRHRLRKSLDRGQKYLQYVEGQVSNKEDQIIESFVKQASSYGEEMSKKQSQIERMRLSARQDPVSVQILNDREADLRGLMLLPETNHELRLALAINSEYEAYSKGLTTDEQFRQTTQTLIEAAKKEQQPTQQPKLIIDTENKTVIVQRDGEEITRNFQNRPTVWALMLRLTKQPRQNLPQETIAAQIQKDLGLKNTEIIPGRFNDLVQIFEADPKNPTIFMTNKSDKDRGYRLEAEVEFVKQQKQPVQPAMTIYPDLHFVEIEQDEGVRMMKIMNNNIWNLLELLVKTPGGLSYEELENQGILELKGTIYNLKRMIRGNSEQAYLILEKEGNAQISPDIKTLVDLPAKTQTSETYGFRAEKLPFEVRNYQDIQNHPDIVNFLQGLEPIQRKLLAGFFASSSADRLLTAIANFNSDDPEAIKYFKQSLAGAIFEEVGFGFLKDEGGRQGLTVLSSLDLFNIYLNLRPHNKPIVNGGLNLGIEGSTVPDGLVFRETETELLIDSILEYKCIRNLHERDKQELIDQAQSLQPDFIAKDLGLIAPSPDWEDYLNTLIHIINPTLPAKPIRMNKAADLKYVLPENSRVSLPGSIPVYIPIPTTTYGKFISILIAAVKSTGEKNQTALAVPDGNKPENIEATRILSNEIELRKEQLEEMEKYQKHLLPETLEFFRNQYAALSHQSDDQKPQAETLNKEDEEVIAFLKKNDPNLNYHIELVFQTTYQHQTGVNPTGAKKLEKQGYIKTDHGSNFSAAETMTINYLGGLQASFPKAQIPKILRERVFIQLVAIFDKKITGSKQQFSI